MSFRLELFDASCETQRAAYERAFYRAFARTPGNVLVRDLWLWDDENRRLQTRIAYADQMITMLRDDSGEIVTALSINVALREVQGERYGFAIPKSSQTCEFLTFFADAKQHLETRFPFWRDSFSQLRERGLTTAYATSAPRLERFYRRIGGSVLERRACGAQERLFWRFDLAHRDWR